MRLSGCAISSVSKYCTPLYDLTLDTQGMISWLIESNTNNYFQTSLVYEELQSTGCFEWMNLETDEDEHSIEMHLPYIAKVFEKWVNYLDIMNSKW